MQLRIKNYSRGRKFLLLLAAQALILALLLIFRTLTRQGGAMLFRFNMGLSIEDAVMLFNYETAVLAAVSLVVFAAVCVLVCGRTPRYEWLFSFLALAFGLIYMFTVTPLSVPDESTHFLAISELTNRLFGMRNTAVSFNGSGFANQDNVCSGYLALMHGLFGREEPQYVSSSIMSYMWTLTYSLEYAPQVLGFALAQLLSFNSLTMFMLGRLFNLLFFVLCLYLAVKRTPRFKLTLGLVALMPMTMQQAASLSYDSFINALSLLLISALLRGIFGEGRLSISDFAFIFIPACLLAPAKGIYSLFILLFVFIPNERFSGRPGKWGSFALLAGACVLTFLLVSLPSILRIMNTTPPSFGSEGGEKYTLAYFFTNPQDAISIFVNSFNVYLGTWLTQAVGQSLSTCCLELPTWIVPMFIVLAILSALKLDDDSVCLPRGMRAVLIALSAAVILAFMMTMFLTWIRGTDKIIVGVQGRYFIPILPLLFIAVNNKTLVLKKNLDKGIALLSVLLSARTILAILSYTMFRL